MKQERLEICGVPALLIGEYSDSIYLFVHGRCGYKEEALEFAELACPRGFQVLAIDLPEHGERQGEPTALLPWNVIPELNAVFAYLKGVRKYIALRANSIGAWFCMMSPECHKAEKALFVSPITDMEQLIRDMMAWSNTSEQQLAQAREIRTDFGETLSWQYYMYSKQNPIVDWKVQTHILYAALDNLTSRQTLDRFMNKFKCDLTVMENGEHWFHTKEQLDFLNGWMLRRI